MSIVQICNRGAAQYLGLPRVNSLTEGTPQSEQYELHYEDLRKGLLQEHWWFFAKSIVALAETTNDRPNDWVYKYNKPAGVLSTHWVNTREAATAAMRLNQNPDTDREDVGEFIYSNIQYAYMQYTRDEDNTDLMPQYFKDALSAIIASAIAIPLTESVSRARFAGEQAEIMVDKAIAKDEENTEQIQMPDADYIRARTGYLSEDEQVNVWSR